MISGQPHYSMKNLLTIILLILAAAPYYNVAAQNQQDIAQRIKSKTAQYKWGEGRGFTETAAKNNAIASLTDKLKLVVERKSTEDITYDNSGGNVSTRDHTTIAACVSLVNTESLIWSERNSDGENEYVAFCYASIADIEAAEQARREKTADMIATGIEQEKNLNIAGALRYYNWAYTMLMRYGDSVQISVEGKTKDATSWLGAKIESVLNNISLSVDESKIEYTPEEYDKYTVLISARYAGNPVTSLAIVYFNGERMTTTHAKDGEAVLKFVDLADTRSLDLKIEYGYLEEAEKSFDEEIKTANAAGTAYTNAARSHVSLPVKIKKDRILPDAKATKDLAKSQPAPTASAMNEAPIIQPMRKTVERNYIDDAACIEKMQAVEKALHDRRYDSVKDLFTDSGYATFRRMAGKARLTVTKQPDYSVESSGLFTIGRAIPVAVKNGRHVTNERMVFRFDKHSGLISSVAYALTKRAENDIFRQAQWNMESRYSLLTFMEDYQTAYILQDIDFIRKIFSDDAIIIVGEEDKVESKKFFDITSLQTSEKRIRYTRHTKDSYLRNLEELFGRNEWTHIEFEDNEISKVPTGGLLDNEVLWIEIRQNWSVARGYNDTGYLALQINMKPSGSQINVRTFTPDFIPLDELKNRFPIGITQSE